MAVVEVAAAHKDPVGPVQKGFDQESQVHPARAHDPDHPQIGRVLKPGNTAKICTAVAAPITQKTDDGGFEILFHFYIFLSKSGSFGLPVRLSQIEKRRIQLI
jgi:hypothetical protein